jgi:predicted DNA-binding transcriptional regulator AlpA
MNFFPPTVTLEQDDLLSSARVKAKCGGISSMTIWRLERRKDFPPPDVIINRRKFWRRSTIEGWLAAHATNEPTT